MIADEDEFIAVDEEEASEADGGLEGVDRTSARGLRFDAREPAVCGQPFRFSGSGRSDKRRWTASACDGRSRR